MKRFKMIDLTVHCKDEEPEECAFSIAKYFEKYNEKNILIIGYQPAIIENLKKSNYNIRVLDLNPENIGNLRYDILIEDGIIYKEAISWCDIILCTGSTIINKSIENFLNTGKTVYFYGTTIAGASEILKLNRLCFKSI